MKPIASDEIRHPRVSEHKVSLPRLPPALIHLSSSRHCFPQ